METNPSWGGIFQSLFAVHQFLREKKCLDAVVCGIDEYSLGVALFAGKYTGVPVFCVTEDPPFTSRYSLPIIWSRKLERWFRQYITRTFLHLCAGIICFIEKDILNELNLENVAIYQFMNGASSQAFEWMKNNPGKKKDNSECVIGYVGTINKDQGIQDLLEIFAEAYRKSHNLRLQLIGPVDGDYSESHRAQINDLGLDWNIKTTGWLPYENMLEKLQECDICVYCSRPNEWSRFAQPLKVCEYLALRKPTVAWDYPGIRRMLDHGRFGILVPSGNKSAFADALIALTSPLARKPIESEIDIAVQGRWASDYWYGQVLNVLASARKG
jgi:glycosyltransferase involved in cell wall biosynthesis